MEPNHKKDDELMENIKFIEEEPNIIDEDNPVEDEPAIEKLDSSEPDEELERVMNVDELEKNKNQDNQ